MKHGLKNKVKHNSSAITRPMPAHHQLQWVWYELAELKQTIKRQTWKFFSSKQWRNDLSKLEFQVAKFFTERQKAQGLNMENNIQPA